jgi:hypothetical protein
VIGTGPVGVLLVPGIGSLVEFGVWVFIWRGVREVGCGAGSMGSLDRDLVVGFSVGQVVGRNVACFRAAGGVGFCLGGSGQSDQGDYEERE